jgi:hypothetical protein
MHLVTSPMQTGELMTSFERDLGKFEKLLSTIYLQEIKVHTCMCVKLLYTSYTSYICMLTLLPAEVTEQS